MSPAAASPRAPDAGRLFRPGARTLAGVVHLPPLARTLPEALVARAVADAETYAGAGFDAVLLENYGDAPWPKDGSAPHVAALLGRCVLAVREATGLPIGVNVLRNDARTALAVAAAAGGSFVRVNVLSGAMVTDQGIIEGDAARVLEYRRALGTEDGPRRVAILADVLVKHAAPLVPRPLPEVASETRHRAGADVLLVTGAATGRPARLADVAVAREAARCPVWVASGVTAETVAATLEDADGALVGTAAKQGGDVAAPVDPARAVAIARAAARPRRS